MKYFVIAFIGLFVVMLCIPSPNRKKELFTIVGKKYKQGGMCHDDSRQERTFDVRMSVYVPVVSHHTHHYEPSTFTIYIARPEENFCFITDSLSFYQKYKVGNQIIY